MGGATHAAFDVFQEFDAVFGALLIIPVYLITRELFGKKAAMIAAVLYTLMPSNLSAGIASGGRMHTPELLFAMMTIYYFLKTVKLSKDRVIIERLSDFRSYRSSIMSFVRENRLPFVYSLLAGAP
ncbi:glycosyltransferase family 39 protein [Thermogymnomonas acidicola]|uniref:glycosyltransferase family 39 protein n=1 Tax=Thermogymnomonas acidicola TaxID=399579 RepID=UPI001396B18C|nr:glycosyltransferase family 39 protein [Thermogymnomonas acidicola]